jgi:hypothetical protein
VATASAAWAFELAQLEDELVGRLRTVAGDVAPRRLRFAVGRLPEPAPPPEPVATDRVEPSADDRAEAERLVAGIDDEALRAAAARAVAQGLAHGESGRSL